MNDDQKTRGQLLEELAALRLRLAAADEGERSRAETQLRNSEAFLNSIIEQSPYSIWISDEKGTLIRLNRACKDVLKISEEDVVGRYNIFEDNIVREQGYMPLVESVFRQGQTVRFELEYSTAQLDILDLESRVSLYLDVTIFPIKDTSGKITNAVIQHVDITERKQAAEALRRERDLLERLMETSPVAIAVLDREGQITFANRQAETVLGLSRDEITQRAYNEPTWRITNFDGEPLSDDQLPFLRVKASGKSVFGVRHAVEKTGGEHIYLSINASPILDHENRFDGMIAVMEDITEQIKAEKALRESEERYRVLVNASPTAIAVIQEGHYAFVNPAMAYMLGYDSLEKVVGLSPLDVTAPEYQSAVRDRVKNAELGKSNPLIEIVLVRSDRSTLFFEAASVPINFQGKPAVLLIGQDTTERRQAETALREREATLKALFNAPFETIALLDHDGIVLNINENGARRLGFAPGELIGKNAYNILPSEIAQSRKAIIDRVFETGSPAHFEDRRAGVQYASSVYPVFDDQSGQVNSVAIYAADITERRQIEEALRESEGKFSRAFYNHPIAMQILDLADGIRLDMNDSFYQLTGYSKEELVGSNIHDLNIWNNPDEVMASLGRLAKVSYTKNDPGEIVTKSGEIRNILISSAVLDLGGKRLAIGSFVDITERKRAEAALLKTQFAVDNSSIAVIVFNVEGRITYVNEMACQNLQYSREELLSMTIPDIDHALRAEGVKEPKKDKNLTSERRHVRKDGTTFPVLVTTTYLDFEGEDLFYSFVLNITALKEAEKQLREYSEHLEEMVEERTVELRQINKQISTILDNTPDAVLLLNGQGIIESANPAFCDFFKCQSYGPLGQPLTSLIAPAYHALIDDYFESIEDQADTTRLEAVANHKDKTSFDADIALAKIKEKDNLIGIVCTIRDISALKAVERMKDEFLATAAHELRTPLTSVRGFSEILLERELSQERQDYYHRIIKEQSTHLAQIIDDLLDISRLEAGHGLELRNETISLDEIISSVVKPFIDTSPQHTFDLVCNSDVPPTIGDPFRLNQVFQNLLSNAVKFSPEGGEISITREVVGDSIRVGIHDQGIGLSKKQQENIFERFYRVDSTSTSIGGTGLGLTISKLIVELHGGNMWVESELGKGSTFFFTLPIQSTED